MRKFLGVAALATAMSLTAAAQAQYLIIGNDEKVAFDDGKQVLSPPGNDTVTIVDISDRAKPRLVVNLQLENSIVGPPTNQQTGAGRQFARRGQGRRQSEGGTG